MWRCKLGRPLFSQKSGQTTFSSQGPTGNLLGLSALAAKMCVCVNDCVNAVSFGRGGGNFFRNCAKCR